MNTALKIKTGFRFTIGVKPVSD